jgi:hypothetical protein
LRSPAGHTSHRARPRTAFGVLLAPFAKGRVQELQRSIADIDERIQPQIRHLETDDDIDHPIVAAARQRIADLTSQRTAPGDALSDQEGRHVPQQLAPQTIDVAAVLSRIPDLRAALGTYSDEELADLSDAFDVIVRVAKERSEVEVYFALADDLSERLRRERPPEGGRTNGDIAGAGFEPATFGL